MTIVEPVLSPYLIRLMVLELYFDLKKSYDDYEKIYDEYSTSMTSFNKMYLSSIKPLEDKYNECSKKMKQLRTQFKKPYNLYTVNNIVDVYVPMLLAKKKGLYVEDYILDLILTGSSNLIVDYSMLPINKIEKLNLDSFVVELYEVSRRVGEDILTKKLAERYNFYEYISYKKI